MKKARNPLGISLKNLLLTKLPTLVLVLATVHTLSAAAASANAQSLSLSLNNVQVKEVIKTIEKQSDYRFFYTEGLSDMSHRVSVNVESGNIDAVLAQVLASTNLGFKVNDNKTIIIAPKETMQNQGKVTGVVTDRQGEPLIGVTVRVKGTQTAGSTDVDGRYSLNNVQPNAVLQFSYIGYTPKEVSVGNNTTLDVVLDEDVKVLDEVVVVGYGTQKKANLTGSVSSISAEKIESRPVANLSTALAGLAAGVSVSQSSGDPNSGANIRVRGTGTFSGDYRAPLIIVDGTAGDMNAINPDDVESISVLKDAASAAIYGSRAANGVVLITTKRGKKDAAPRLTYSGMISSEQPSNTYDFLTDYALYMEAFNRAQKNMNPAVTGRYNQSTIDAWREASKNPNGTSEYGIPNWLAYPNTDWNKALFQDKLYQKHNLSVSGGSKNSNYLLSLMYMDNPGTMDNTALTRYQIRANVESKVTDFLKFGTQTFAMKQTQETGNSNGAFTYMFQTVPGMTPFSNGKYGYPEAAEEDGTANNLLWFLNDTGGQNTTTRISTTWYAGIDIWKGLSAEGRFNYQDYRYDSDTYSQSNDMYSFRTDQIMRYGTTLDNASIGYSGQRMFNYTAQATLNYLGTFGDHNINAMVGYEQYYYDLKRMYLKKHGFADWSIHDIASVTEMDVIAGSSDANSNTLYGGEYNYGMLSYLGRLNYSYKDKYLFEANFRRDGSSRFAPENRWGNFPSFSAAWRITEESFMQGTRSFLDNLKLRASWGQLGNVTSGYYDWQATYAPRNTSFGNHIFNGLSQGKIANPLLSWESVDNLGVGLDISTLNQRLNVEVEYYNRLTKGILTSPAIPLTMGTVTPPTKNTSDMRNQGIELTLGWNDRIGDFSYSASVNFAYNQNEIVKYLGKMTTGWFYADGTSAAPRADGATYTTNVGKTASFNGLGIRTEGYMIDEYYIRTRYKGTGTYKNADGTVDPKGGPKDGMIRTPEDLQWVKDMKTAGYSFGINTVGYSGLWYGEQIMADLNEDGIYGSVNDRQFTGKSSLPKYTYGFNLSASWKGFDFNMQWAGQGGMYYYLYERGINSSNLGDRTAMAPDVMSRYYYYNENNPDDPANNINARYPRLKYASGGAYIENDSYLYNASYIKLKNIQLGYTFPKKWINKAYINNLRLFVTGENLVTITDYPGLDPELGSGINVYPISKQYSVGLNLTF